MTTDLDPSPGTALDELALAVPADTADLLFRSARTVQQFTAEPVSDETLAAAWDLAKWGPTAMNTLPLRLLVVRGSDARARLAAHMNEGNRSRVLAAPVAVLVAADHDFHQHLPTLAPHAAGKADELAAAPAVRAQMARTNASIQLGYLIVALRAVGLGVGPMSGMDAAGMDADLLAGTGWHALAVLNVGHVQGEGGAFPRAPRLSYDQVASTL